MDLALGVRRGRFLEEQKALKRRRNVGEGGTEV